MAWPSTKAGTTNVDAGSDSPSSARADIKQNIDNVNAIIDEFDIASPSNGDILIYNSTSGAWEPGSAASIGSTNPIFIGMNKGQSTSNTTTDFVQLNMESSGVVESGATYTTNNVQLAAGDYAIRIDGSLYTTKSSGHKFGIYDGTDWIVAGTQDYYESVYSGNTSTSPQSYNFLRKLNITSATDIKFAVKANAAQTGVMGLNGALITIYSI